MSTSDGPHRSVSSGLGVIELLVGLSLGLCLALAVAPLFASLQFSGVEQADRSVQAAQARVAAARFEHDMRLASGSGSLFATNAPLLDASTSRVMFLVRPEPQQEPILVGWEIAGGNLMRRWGRCPTVRPPAFKSTLFIDHKTMLEGLRAGSSLTYRAAGRELMLPLSLEQLPLVDQVVLELNVAPGGAKAVEHVSATGRVGR